MPNPLLDRLLPLPLIAILRGIEPGAVRAVGDILAACGFRCLEVPLNSPRPFDSIATLADSFGARMLVGAGTVLRSEDVARVAAAGGRLVVMPHADVAIIREAKRLGLICVPGVATPTEGFAALAAGADGLKLFPGELIAPAIVKAWRAVFPPEVPLLPTGGITPERMEPYLAAGADGFGIGSALFQPGIAEATLRDNARAFVDRLSTLKRA